MELLADATEYIYYNDKRGAMPFVNLKPSYGSWSYPNFAAYVSSYADVVHPAILLCTHYPILSGGTDRPEFYSDIGIIRQEALDAGIGFMGFVLVNGHSVYREPSESDLRWQVYSLITYGAHGIWYYNYRIEPIDGFAEGLVTHADGTPTATYTLAQAVNAELKTLGLVLLKLLSTGVYHTGSPTPAGATAYTNGVIGVISNFVSDNFLLGESQNQDDPADDDTYVMVTNKRHGAGQSSASLAASATFTANPVTLKVYQYDPATGNQQLLTGSNGTYTININGGQGTLLRFSAD
jgi:hypothetical protein